MCIRDSCQTEEIRISALAELIAQDPGMSSKTIGMANGSAYQHTVRKIGLEQSITALGIDSTKNMVISESVFQVFNSSFFSNSADLRFFWQHSLETAIVARAIAEKMRYPHLEEAYLAGLLHDVGRLALITTAPSEYASNFPAKDDEMLCAIEQSTLRIAHPEAGSWLVESWNLDSFMADSVLYHHEPMALSLIHI